MSDTNQPVPVEPITQIAAKLVTEILTRYGLDCPTPDDGDLDDVEVERWAACCEVAERVVALERWQPIEAAPEDVRWVAAHARPPQLGQLAGQVFALSEGRWLVVKSHVTRGTPESFLIIAEPPATSFAGP